MSVRWVPCPSPAPWVGGAGATTRDGRGEQKKTSLAQLGALGGDGCPPPPPPATSPHSWVRRRVWRAWKEKKDGCPFFVFLGQLCSGLVWDHALVFLHGKRVFEPLCGVANHGPGVTTAARRMPGDGRRRWRRRIDVMIGGGGAAPPRPAPLHRQPSALTPVLAGGVARLATAAWRSARQ